MRKIVLLAALICSANVLAHELLTTEKWCAGGVVHMTGAFSFSAPELGDHAACLRSGACVVSVFARSEEERQYVEQLLLQNRAHITARGAERGNNRP